MNIRSLLKDAYAGWSKHEVSRLAASLAYYAILSLAPLVLIVLGIAGAIFGAGAARQGLLTQVQALVGPEGAQMVDAMISHGSTLTSDVVTSLVGVLTLLFGASGVFAELHESLDKVWEARVKPRQGFWAMLRERFLSFGMVLVIGFLLLVSLVLSSGFAAMGSLFGRLPALVSQGTNFLLSVAVITLLFAAIYRFLPSERLPWSDLWVGSLGTSIAFVIGKFLLGFYLGRASVGSGYGAAGSLVLLLVWIYYAAQIFFFGAEFTRAYARRHGSLLRREVVAPAQVTRTEEVLRPVTAPSKVVTPRTKSEIVGFVVACGWIGINWWAGRQRRVR